MLEKFDIVVIGGGTAGLVTASGCVRLGRKVALITGAGLCRRSSSVLCPLTP